MPGVNKTCTVAGVSPDPILCPACRALDWSRDGFRIRLLPDGSMQSRRIAVASDGAEAWVCSACGYRVVVWGILHARLNGERAAQGE